MNDEPILHIVLYQPQIPPNTGNIGRTCVALQAKLWLVRPLGFQIDAKHLRRAGLDYWQHLNWEVVDNWQQLIERLGPRPMWLLTKTATRDYITAEFRPGDALIFGSETDGLPASLRVEHAEHCLRIPMNPLVRSLNLSASAAIVAYEAHRQFVVRGDLP